MINRSATFLNTEDNLNINTEASSEEELNLDAFSGIVSADDKEFSFMSNESSLFKAHSTAEV